MKRSGIGGFVASIFLDPAWLHRGYLLSENPFQGRTTCSLACPLPEMSMPLRQKWGDLRFEQFDQSGLHELVVVRDVEAHNTLAHKARLETSG